MFERINNCLFKISNVPADGNCFFHCLSYAIHHDFTHSQMYRNLTCQNVANEWDTWKDKVKICHGEHMSLEMYRMGMLNGNWWAGSSEIEVASALLNCEINIFLKGTTENQTAYTISTYKPEAGSNTVINLLLYRQHFQILERVIPDNINTTSVQQASCSDNTSKQTCPIVHPSNHTHDHSYVKVQKQQHFIHIDHNYSCNPEPVTDYNKSSKGLKRKKTYESAKKTKVEDDLYHICRKLGIWYDNDNAVKTSTQNEIKKLQHRIKQRQKQIDTEIDQIPDPPPLSNDCQFNKAMDCIRAFELEQMNYTIYTCKTCCESRIEMKLSDGICKRCRSDKGSIKMFSDENIMDPKPLPNELSSMTLIEQQLIARISPCIHIHMLKHGGIASSGHCVTFPQEINEPAQIFPRLPQEIDIVKVRKYGKNDTSKDFRIRRFKVQTALLWLQQHNPAYSDIIICPDRLNALPEDGDACNMQTLEVNNVQTSNDNGPAFQQIDPGAVDGNTNSGTLLPPQHVNLQKAVEDIVTDITMENDDKTKINKKQTITIPWPTRGKVPMSEFTTQYFFTLAFPCLFPYGRGDYHINRPITCSSIAQWADHLLWYSDGRFAHHQYFKFVVHNIIMRNNAIQKGNFIVHQQLGDSHMTVSELRQKFKDEGESFAKKIVHLSATLRGTSQYWAQRAKELRALTQYKITLGHGLPSFFATGSCAEFHFKPLRRLLKNYVQTTTKKDINLEDRSILYDTLQKNTHIVAHYFDLRTKSYFENVMGPVFGVDTYWYRQEFAKSRGMIHWHGLCWRSDKQPHLLMYNAVKDGLSDDECALKLEKWAALQCGLTACHPAGKDENGNSRQDLWPPPEGTAPQPNEENNPLVKLLMDASESQESLLEDYLLLTNRFNLHRCSDYCLKASNNNTKKCRMEFGTEQSPGKKIRDTPALVKDHNGSTRLEMTRDHPVLVQHSRYHTQGWRANGDISVILSKSSPDNPSVHDIIATEKYITGYACKGNQPTGAISNLFCDMINCSNDASGLTAKSICNKVLISTVKRDISAVEASYELSALPLYRSSHQFKSVNLSGVRLLEKNVNTATRNNAIDKYILRPQHDTASLYTFVCRDGRIPVFSGCSTQPVWPLDDEYSRTMLVLHWPNWRHLSDLKPEHISWSEQMNIFLCTEQCPNFVKADIDRVKQKSESLDVDEESEIEDASSQQPEWVDLMKPNTDFEVTDSDFQYNDGGENYNWNATAIPYPNDLGVSWIESLKEGLNMNQDADLKLPDIEIMKMNEEQKFVFNLVMSKTLAHVNNDANFEPLRLIVSGTAGSGKSYLIKCLVKALRQLFNTNTCVQVICPTGNSANLISGVTIHSFLKIPTNQKGKDMTPPEGQLGMELQKNCCNLKVLLVDERSLIGATTLGWMEFNCRHGVSKTSDCEELWGGLPVVVFFGDDVQLPPVLDSPVYDCKGKSTAALHGALVWKEFSHAATLRTSIRQNGDEDKFKTVLLSLREYKATREDAVWLQNFQWKNLERKYGRQKLLQMERNALYIFPTNNEVWIHNKNKILEVNQTFPIAKITAICKGPHSKSVPNDKANGLLHSIFLCRAATVMLTVNLCVSHGLYNGAIGNVVDIVYPPEKRPGDALPVVVMVEFPNYNGPPFIDSNPKVVPVVPIERRVDCQCYSCKRKQVPLKLGWATTIHKCQGMTVGTGETHRYIVINPGPRAFESRNPGALFVALSRAKSAGNLENEPDFAFHPSVLVNEDRLCWQVKTRTVQARSAEISRIEKLSAETEKKYEHLKQSDEFLSIMSTNHIQCAVDPEE